MNTKSVLLEHSSLDEIRRQKDDFFRSPASPLPPEQRATFVGLRYFPGNPALRFLLVLAAAEGAPWETLDTSTGAKRRYERAGRIRFSVGNQKVTLTVFSDENGYFLPFRDRTSGKETYGAGRYLEPEMEDGKLLIDFNLAYNPYCAYSERYSCPLPPRVNWLGVSVEAGEKNPPS